MANNFIKGYYFVTDSSLSRAGNLSDINIALDCGVSIIQLREKNISLRIFLEEARKVKDMCKTAKLIINDSIDIALAVGADGVHIGQDDIPLAEARRLLDNY